MFTFFLANPFLAKLISVTRQGQRVYCMAAKKWSGKGTPHFPREDWKIHSKIYTKKGYHFDGVIILVSWYM